MAKVVVPLARDDTRTVPQWPMVNTHALTPVGLGKADGNQPCFSTEQNRCLIHVPFSLVSNEPKAREIFRQVKPIIDKMWVGSPGDRTVAVVFPDGEGMLLHLKFAFSHILVKLSP